MPAGLDGSAQAPSQVQGLLSSLFGDKIGGVTQGLAQVTGLPGDIMGKVLTFAAPFVMSLVARKAAAEDFRPSALADLLSSQRGAVVTALPAGIGAMLGLDAPGTGAWEAASGLAAAAGTPPRTRWAIPARHGGRETDGQQ